MTTVLEKEKVKNRKRSLPSFSPPEWSVISFPEPSQVDPEIYLRKEDINRHGTPYTVIILDEHIHDQGGGTEMVIQWILGHHRQRLPKAYEHQGWQGPEMIRKFYRTKLMTEDGKVKYQSNEADISKEQSINCNAWGRILSQAS